MKLQYECATHDTEFNPWSQNKPNKKSSSTEVRTQAKGFKVPCANHYTIELLSDSLPNLFLKTFNQLIL